MSGKNFKKKIKLRLKKKFKIEIMSRRSLKASSRIGRRGRGAIGRNPTFVAMIRRRRFGANAKATRALRLIRRFKKEEELKQIDVTGSSTVAFANSGTWQTTTRILLNPLAQGTTSETRIGKKVTPKNLTLRIKLNRASTDASGIYYRIVIFVDRKPAGAVPTPTTIFETDQILSPLNRANAGRFGILYDEFVNMNNDTFHYPVKFFALLNKVGMTDYGLGNSGDITDISKGAIYLWINGDSLDTADSSFAYNSRIKFTDA